MSDKVKSNKELLEKAIDSSWGGQLNTDDVNEFFTAVRDQAGWLSRVQWLPMESNATELHLVNIGDHEFQAGTEGTDPTHVASGSSSAQTLTLYEAVLPFDITYKQLNHSIIANPEEFLKNQFLKAFKNGIANNVVTGSTVNSQRGFKVFNGMLKTAESNGGSVHYVASIASSSAANEHKTFLKETLAELPDKYRFATEDLVYFVSWDFADGYAEEAGNRETPAGDQYMFSGGTPDYRGIPVVPVAQMPSETIILTAWDNIFVGYSVKQGDFSVGMFDDTRQRQLEYTVTGEVGFAFSNLDLVVVNTGSFVS